MNLWNSSKTDLKKFRATIFYRQTFKSNLNAAELALKKNIPRREHRGMKVYTRNFVFQKLRGG